MNQRESTNTYSAVQLQRAVAAFLSELPDLQTGKQRFSISGKPFDLIRCIRCLWSKVVVIILCGVLCAAVAGVVALVIPPEYEATAKLYIMNNEESEVRLYALQSGTLLMPDYREVFKTWEVHEQVRSQLELDLSYQQMQRMLTVQIPDGSRLLYISIRHRDPVVAAKMANAYAQAGYTFITQSLQGLEPSHFSSAMIPGRTIGLGITGWCLLAFASGLLISTCAYVLAYCLDSRICDPQDLRNACELSVLASIPCRTEDLTVEEKEAACLLASRLRTVECVLVTAPNIGDGVSFVCADLVLAMSALHRKALWIRVEHKPFWNHSDGCKLADYLEDRCGWRQLVHPCEGGALLSITGTEDELPSQLFHPRMAGLMEKLRGEYDIILVDVPPLDERADGAAFMTFCDGILLVASCGQSRYEDVHAYMGQLTETACPLLGAVLNRAGSKAAEHTPFAAHGKAGVTV